jgi:GTP cyclohydrolase FolE2
MPLCLNADIDVPPTIARIRAEVSLDDESKRGIHMSRLYLACDELFSHNSIDFSSLANLTQNFLDTHV